MTEPNEVTHIDDDGVRYSYLGENSYAVFMDKERNPHWREMPNNNIECASSLRSVADIERIAELEAVLKKFRPIEEDGSGWDFQYNEGSEYLGEAVLEALKDQVK